MTRPGTNKPLYLLKQQLREIYRVPAEHAIALLDAWLAWARRCLAHGTAQTTTP